jgi:predicted DNA-binding transcriptional regulator YafY
VFKLAENVELSQISLTGLRALIFIGLLIVQPRSFDEIKKKFIDLKIMDENHSDDIIRIDLNTIKIMGCDIARSSPKTNGKYVLTKHPFTLKIQQEELDVLKKVYNVLKTKVDLRTLIEYDELFKRIASYIYDETSKEELLGISSLKYYNIQTIKDLLLDCKHKRTLDLIYKKSNSATETRRLVVAQDIKFKNDKVYLYGFDLKSNKQIVLNLRRIKSIIARLIKKDNVETNNVIVKFAIKDIDINDLDINEEVIARSDDECIIEGSYHNDFIAMQRILSFGSKCTVLEPEIFKKNIINKIKEMRKIYECNSDS